MSAPMANGVTNAGQHQQSGHNHYDALIIGAGFSGLRMLHEARQIGISARILEKGLDVGGTWYWNRYPGARTDSESWTYIMNFFQELKTDYVWKQRYPTQDDVYQYLRHVADRFDVRRDISFDTEVQSAHYDEAQKIWTVTTTKGETYTCTFFVPAVGLLSAGLQPPYPGLDTFKGEWYLASRWPRERVDFAGKRIAVVGTGATGVQIIPIVAHNAKSLTVFQRTPNYVVPARNAVVTDEQMTEIRRTYDDIWKLANSQVFGFAIPTRGRTMENVPDPEERQRVLEAGWEAGGFHFVCETFDDIATSKEANDLAADFVRRKIRTIVRDPKTAELLSPHYPLLVKRPPLGHFYYEAFNRPNVQLVDISGDKNIEAITPTGLRTKTAEYEFDMIIFAIGFDAVTGPLGLMDIRGRDNRSLRHEWTRKGLKTYLSMMVEGFPNMLIISGPQGPFGNLPVYMDSQVAMLGKAIRHMRERGYKTLEPTHDAQERWSHEVRTAFDGTLLASGAEESHSWYTGSNVPGKPFDVLIYFGGLNGYNDLCADEVTNGFPGIHFT